MRLTEILLLLLVGWTAIGIVGIAVSWRRGERQKAARNLGWVVGIWTLYMAVLVGVSLVQPQRFIAPGTPQCFGKMCYTVAGAEELPGYLAQNARLVRVHINIANHGSSTSGDSLLHAYLLDTAGRRWTEISGLSGVRLTAKIPAGGTVTNEPIFKLPSDVVPQGIVLTHGRLQPGFLVIGDPDSMLHRPTIAKLR